MPHRRTLALAVGALLLATPALSSCGFNLATDRVNTTQHGATNRDKSVDVLAAGLGIGVHFLRALWGLVPDNADGWTYLPLKLGLRLGASKLLWASSIYTAGILVGLAFAATSVGLAQ